MRSLVFVVLFAFAAPVAAQKASRSARPPASRLQGEEPEDAAGPPTAAACPATCGDAERALAIGLVHAFEQGPEEIRVLAVEDLGLLGDPRALDAIATLVLDANPRVQAAAVRAASQFTTLRATQILENVVRHPRLPQELKEQALRALPFQRRPRVKAFLAAVANAAAYNPALRKIAREGHSAFDAPNAQSGAAE